MLSLLVKEKIIEILDNTEYVRGTIGAKCKISFDEFWTDYNKTIVFKRADNCPITLLADMEFETDIPYEVMRDSGEFTIGAYGTISTDDKTYICTPTLWSEPIKVVYGTDTYGIAPQPPTPTVYDNIISSYNKLLEDLKNLDVSDIKESVDNNTDSIKKLNTDYIQVSKDLSDETNRAKSKENALETKINENTSELSGVNISMNFLQSEISNARQNISNKQDKFADVSDSGQNKVLTTSASRIQYKGTTQQDINISGADPVNNNDFTTKRYAEENFAPVIKNTASRVNALRVDDVSDYGQAVKVVLKNKNLFDINNPMTGGYSVDSAKNHPIKIESNALYNGGVYGSTDGGSVYVPTGGADTFTFSFYAEFEEKEGATNFSYVRSFNEIDTESGLFSSNIRLSTKTMVNGYNSVTVKNIDKAYIAIAFISSLGYYKVKITDLQIEAAEEATDYTPYISDLSAVSVSRYGKNLFYPNSSVTYSGVTITYENDGVITLNGTQNHVGNLPLAYIPIKWNENEDYTFSVTQVAGQAKVGSGTGSTYVYGIFSSDNTKYIRDRNTTRTVFEDVSFTKKSFLSNNGMYHIYLQCWRVNTVFNNYKIKIQLELGTTATEYTPYIDPQTAQSDENGDVEGLTSMSPDMTLISDTPGVIINCEYKADTKKYIDNKFAELQAAIINTVTIN